MELQDINNIANDLAVFRLEIQQLKEQLEQSKTQEQIGLEALISSKTMQKEQVQEKLMQVMRDNSLKSWKTEEANFARSIRYSVLVDPEYKKQVLGMLKDGEKVEGFALNETEFISIRSVKK